MKKQRNHGQHSTPFIGITGLSTAMELGELMEIAAAVALPRSHELNVGVLVSDATLAGEPPRLSRFPAIQDVASLLEGIQAIGNPILHYNSRSERPLSDQIQKLFEHAGIYERDVCRRVQLNVKEPEPKELEKTRRAIPELRIVIQVPLWKESFRDAKNVEAFVHSYEESADYFILDLSGGRGTALSEENVALIEVLSEKGLPPRRMVLAGGLSGATVEQVCSTMRNVLGTGEFSVDAEGKLRGGKHDGRKVGDHLNPTKVREYLSGACRDLWPGKSET